MDQIDQKSRNHFINSYKNVSEIYKIFTSGNETFKSIFNQIDLINGLVDELKVANEFYEKFGEADTLDELKRLIALKLVAKLLMKIAIYRDKFENTYRKDFLCQLMSLKENLNFLSKSLSISSQDNDNPKHLSEDFTRKSINYLSPSETILMLLNILEILSEFNGKFIVLLKNIDDILKNHSFDGEETSTTVSSKSVLSIFLEKFDKFEIERMNYEISEVLFYGENFVLKYS